VSQDFSTHAKDLISLHKASEWAQSHVYVSYDKFGGLGDAGVIVKKIVLYYAVVLVYSSCVGF
jgi:hypothetical protein